MTYTAEFLIETLGLEPLPEEGGYFRETYRSKLSLSRDCLDDRFDGPRGASTAIYYLITPDSFSALHRLRSDEIFHFYLGDPVSMLQLHPGGRVEEITMGQDFRAQQQPQVVVPAGTWQGTALVDGGAFALLGTTVAPSFEFADFELGSRDQLIEEYPAAEPLIRRLTR